MPAMFVFNDSQTNTPFLRLAICLRDTQRKSTLVSAVPGSPLLIAFEN